MNDFNKLCKIFEEMDPAQYTLLLAEKSAKVMPALALITGTGEDAVALFATFALGAVAADGRLSEEEYALLYPILRTCFGDNVDYAACKDLARALRPESRELKKYVNDLVDVLGLLSDELKDDLVLICMMLCAVDGKISFAEKNWIKQLIR